MKKIISLLLVLGACKDAAPPMALGKCRIMSYNSGGADVMECAFEGYLWTCPDRAHCSRGPLAPTENATAPTAPMAAPARGNFDGGSL